MKGSNVAESREKMEETFWGGARAEGEKQVEERFPFSPLSSIAPRPARPQPRVMLRGLYVGCLDCLSRTSSLPAPDV
ncbi:hypothetical protein E2C01_005810 [Portunus trituberculatus]|uniref:Uncharacterized protein n=1 Tax=Portunus trituberculatus TaxID=210409 RepID=A0A5B7CUE2_PORTR|nr:hypothetical protein [Portunus trituberculatus]